MSAVNNAISATLTQPDFTLRCRPVHFAGQTQSQAQRRQDWLVTTSGNATSSEQGTRPIVAAKKGKKMLNFIILAAQCTLGGVKEYF